MSLWSDKKSIKDIVALANGNYGISAVIYNMQEDILRLKDLLAEANDKRRQTSEKLETFKSSLVAEVDKIKSKNR